MVKVYIFFCITGKFSRKVILKLKKSVHIKIFIYHWSDKSLQIDAESNIFFQVGAGPTITLPNGKIEGISTTTLRNKITYYAYMGIPFAAPPLGKLRFKVIIYFIKWKII